MLTIWKRNSPRERNDCILQRSKGHAEQSQCSVPWTPQRCCITAGLQGAVVCLKRLLQPTPLPTVLSEGRKAGATEEGVKPALLAVSGEDDSANSPAALSGGAGFL